MESKLKAKRRVERRGDYIHGSRRWRDGTWESHLRSRGGDWGWGVVLAIGNFLDRHILNAIGIRLELVDVQHQNIALDLFGYA